MRITGVDTVFVKVTDLDRALAWYREALGLSAGPRHDRLAVARGRR